MDEIERLPASNQSRGMQMIASDEQLERYRLVGRAVELLQRMPVEDLTDLVSDLEKGAAARMIAQ